jgi:hypothetical protein
MNIYPNPGNGMYTITFSKVPQGTLDITVMDISGKLLSKSEIRYPLNEMGYSLDLRKFADGVYQVIVRGGDFINHRIIVKE